MRRKLNREETYTALYWFYIDGKDLGTISRDLQCSIYDLSPWITEVATRIILGLPERNPDLQAVAKLLADMDHVSEVVQFLADETPTNTDDDTYTEGVAGDGAAILKDGVPLTITQILDILNGRTRR